MTTSETPTRKADDALVDLLGWLDRRAYDFITPTPATHRLVSERSTARSEHFLRDVFGWTRAFRRQQAPPEILALMTTAQIVVDDGDTLRSTMRASRLAGRLFLHSAPTRDDDAVFLGPDSYRFARLLQQQLAKAPLPKTALDIGSGAGVGAMVVKDLAPDSDVVASDINPAALRLIGLNARNAGLEIHARLASGLPDDLADFDLIVANPPYIAGDAGKTYRDGGDDHGTVLALDWMRSGVMRLAPAGRFILYTGAPIIAGRDVVKAALTKLCGYRGLHLDYDEIDPDVFGRTLRQRAYADVERIAAIGAIITRPA